MELTNKIVAITGAGQGIGRAIACVLAKAGAHPVLIDVNSDALGKTAELCAGHGIGPGNNDATFVADVSNEAAVEQLFSDIATRFGRLDGLVNNAGIVRDGLLIKARDGELIGKMQLDQWQAVINVNLTGVFLCAREAAAQMVRLGNGGVIVNMSSIARHGNMGQTNYSAAKAGVVAMSTVWARELARYGIRVAAVAPGFTETDILSAMKPEVLEKMLAPVPLKRLGSVDEIAQSVRFIFENEFFTGRCLDLDGGLRM
jgi:3-oxoacyl-[acyl-carrier protein] reductase